MEASAMCYGAANATCNFSPLQQGQCESWKTSSSSSSSSSCNSTSAATNKQQQQQQQNESYLCRSPVDLNMNSFSLSPIDFEPLPNLFTFAQCGSSYKDFSLYKEKNPHDMADVLLSLKHAVVRPGQMHQLGSLPPLSPVAGVSATTFSPITYAHGQQLSPNLYGSVTSPSSIHHGYAPPTSQYYIESPCSTQSVSAGNLTVQANQPSNNNPQTFQSGQPNLFPSMSLNVSMNMTMGMGAYNMMDHHHHHHHQHQMNVNPTGPQLHHHQTHHQIPSWTSATMSTQPSLHQNPASNYPTLQMPYATHTYPATGSYTFAAELRSPNNPSNTLDIDRDFLFSSHTSASHPAFRTTLKTSPKTVTAGNLSEPAVTCKKRPRVHQELTPLTKTNLCRICGKTYARPSTLKVHIRTHTGQKPYRCADCAKSFSQAANLSAHARTHSGEKPFGCPICGRRFSQSSSVTTHIRTHSGERPYGCPVLNCKKAFSDSSTLTKHLRIHTGQKPYECRICSLRFSQSGNLNRHMRIHAAAA